MGKYLIGMIITAILLMLLCWFVVRDVLAGGFVKNSTEIYKYKDGSILEITKRQKLIKR